MTIAARSAVDELDRMLGTYRSATGPAYDEMLDRDGAMRDHWRPLLNGLAGIGMDELGARAQRLERRVRETGIAYDIFADPLQTKQRWSLDLVPLIFDRAQWQKLEAAVVQRAQLFDAILADLYGAQTLMRRGLIPPGLVFSDRAFLRPCEGLYPRTGGLQFYAADLARDAEGRWRLIDNHSETLAGVGFAVANRVAHTQIVGDLFKSCNAVRLSAFFQNLQRALTAQVGREDARIALLTPGPHHEDYFSHAYIARYLGYLLVEGNDLRTKGQQVFLKTLEGLKPIDLIVRCVDGALIDPLELDPTGFLGPTGLLRVNREQPRLVTNPVGSAIVQNRALGAYLPEICKTLLGEDLAMEDAPRLWLGDHAAQQRVAADFDRYVIRRAQEGTGRPGQAALGEDPRRMSADERDHLARELVLFGKSLVAEEDIGFSTAPVLGPNGLEPRPFAMRMFVSRTKDGFVAMPGGLAMTLPAGRTVALRAPDGKTRDVWVVSDHEQEPHMSLWRPKLETARIDRSQRVIQSRVADDLFWLGRYAERADWTMRVARSALRRLDDDSGAADGRQAAVRCLNALLVERDPDTMIPLVEPKTDDIEGLCLELIWRGKSARTLRRTSEGLYRVAHLVRDRLSLEAWRTLSRFRPGEPWLRTIEATTPSTILDHLDDGLQSIAAFNGLVHENMTRNYGWSFMDMGRRLERAYNLAEAIHALFIPAPDVEDEAGALVMLLEVADSYITYRSRYRIDPALSLVLDLLLLDETNPRSMAYQLAAASAHLEGLPQTGQSAGLPDDKRIILSLLTDMRLTDVREVSEEPKRALLAALSTRQLRQLPELSNAISRHYFSLTEDGPRRVVTRTEPKYEL